MKSLTQRDSVNIDVSFRCSLECPNCQRTRYFKNQRVRGQDLSIEDLTKVAFHFKKIHFCGQFSDPVHHPKFIKLLEICHTNNNFVYIHNASSAKSKDWYIKAFNTYPKAEWLFGIDGLPHQSHLYRKNQDGEKLFEIMLEAKKYLLKPPIWQYIVFKYNENEVEKAKQIAKDNGLKFSLVVSSRWNGPFDPLIPTKEEYRMSEK